MVKWWYPKSQESLPKYLGIRSNGLSRARRLRTSCRTSPCWARLPLNDLAGAVTGKWRAAAAVPCDSPGVNFSVWFRRGFAGAGRCTRFDESRRVSMCPTAWFRKHSVHESGGVPRAVLNWRERAEKVPGTPETFNYWQNRSLMSSCTDNLIIKKEKEKELLKRNFY